MCDGMVQQINPNKGNLMTRKLIGLLPVLILLVGLCGCVGGGEQAEEYYADEQEMNEMRSMRYQLTYNQGENFFYFNEGAFKARFEVFPDRAYHFQFDVTNTTGEPMVIFWNRAEYVDLLGNPHSIIHDGVHYLDPVSAQKPTVIQVDQSYSDLLRPADRETVDGAQRFARIKDPGADSYGDYVILVLPMKVEGEYRSYHFSLPLGALLGEWPDSDPYWY